MAMYKSLFDLSIEETTSTEMPHTVKFSNETGTGSMIICPLFLGAELYYNDMHLAFFEEATAPMRNVIEINHCRVGRYECSFGANQNRPLPIFFQSFTQRILCRTPAIFG